MAVDIIARALAAKASQEGSSGTSGATFIPTVSPEGVISWKNDKGLPNPDPVDIKGPAYVLTESDKQEIVDSVISKLPVYNGEVE